jgi:hypothetical protein
MKLRFTYFLLLFPVLLQAQTGGTGVFEFLNLSNSARVSALGGKNISINDNDLSMVFYNPALLKESMSDKLVINYVPYFSDINFGYAGYAKTFKKIGVLAFGIQYINYGKFIAADESGIISGEFSAADYSLNIMWSKKITDKITGGITFIPIYSHLESYTSVGIAFNAGINYLAESGLSASFLIKNAGTQLKPYYEGNFEKLPFDIQAGITKKLEHAPFSVNVTAHHLNMWNLDYSIPDSQTYIFNTDIDTSKFDFVGILDNSFRHIILGVEFVPFENFYAAISYNHQRHQELKIIDKSGATGISWGFGVKLKKWGISFSRSTYHLAGGSNNFSFYLNLKELRKTNQKVNITNQ